MTTLAVVFDLFGTLVTWPSDGGIERAVPLARVIGLDPEAFWPWWRRTRDGRDSGHFTVESALRWIGDELRLALDDAELPRAIEANRAFFRRVLEPRAGAIETLTTLRERGLKLGLMSDCALEVARLWPEAALSRALDAAVFSCELGARKPDPRLYARACELLDVWPSACVYVGNGDGDELAGALRGGMRAILFTGPGEREGRAAKEWAGRRIAELPQVIDLL